MLRRIIRLFAWSLAVLAFLVMGLYVYLRSADLSVYQSQIEKILARSIGHELDVGGLFELRFGPTTVIVAEDAALVNPDWPGDGELIRVGHLTFAFNTWSLFSSTFLVEELRATDVSGKLLRDEGGRINWISERIQPQASDGAAPDLNRVAFRKVDIEGVEFLYEDPRRPRPVLSLIEFLRISPDENDILDLDLRGDVNELPLWADGKIGPWRNFVDGQDILADLEMTLGPARLSLEGRVADVVQLEGVELTAVLAGPAIERALERLGVPPFASGEFQISADVQQQDVGHRVRLDGTLGQISLFASGSTDSFPLPRSVNYDFSITGPDAGAIAELAGIDAVAAAPFQVSGEYWRDNSVIGFNDALLRVGQNALGFTGDVDLDSLDIFMAVNADGPDFSMIGPFIDLDGLPSAPYSIRGEVRRVGAAWEANEVDARVGDNLLAVSGRVETGSNAESRITLRADGPDISILQDFTDLAGIPSRPYDIDVVVRSHPDGILIEQGTGIFGENRVDAQGKVALAPGLVGTSGTVRLSGPEFHNVALLSGVPYLPAGPFDIAGDVAVRSGALRLDGVSARVGELQASASGTVGTAGGERGQFDLDVTLAGPDLSALPEVQGLEVFAGDPFRMAGRIARAGESLTATGLDVSVGNFAATLTGSVSGAAEQVRLSVSASAEDSLMVRKIAGLNYLPAGPVVIDGDFDLSGDEIRLSETRLSVGEYRVEANGSVNLRPRSNNSDLVFSFSGPSLYEVGLIRDFTLFADKEFSVSGEFAGTASGFEVDELIARIGDNDLRGEFDANLEGKPQFVATLTSSYLDLTDRFGQGGVEEPDEDAPEESGDTGDGRYFSDQPLDTSGLQLADIDVKLRVGELISNSVSVTDVEVGVRLQNGALQVEPISLRQNDGSIEARVSLAPEQGQYRLSTRLEANDIRVGAFAPGDADIESLPQLNGSLALDGVGNSIRSILASANGSLSFRQGAGKVRNVFGSAVFRDILFEVFRRLNPLRKTRDYQLLECGIYEVSVTEGIATIDNLAIQTDAMTTIARGEINLRNERLDLAFRAKPREGIGISLGTVVNELLEVRGTLKSPRIGVDAGRTATTTGAAVATGGLSLLARGLWDRISAEGDICNRQQKQDERR
ncbi:MAG: AsmA-like C-terminal region-containing protein [Woeseiaceae bacterium]|nr:AsmA-like C-terminal region-containing protein [Woeseiaceae bacterium]